MSTIEYYKQTTVTGYIRLQCVKLFVMNWPVTITNIVLLYFFINDSLSLRTSPYGKINNNCFVVTKNAFKWITMWGHKSITGRHKLIHFWDFSFSMYNPQAEIIIGISSKLSTKLQTSIMYDCIDSTRISPQFADHHYYCISSKGRKIRQEGIGRRVSEATAKYYYNTKLTWGYNKTKLRMKFDCTNDTFGKLQFFINNQHQKYFNFNSVKFYSDSNKNNVYTLCISCQLFAVRSIKLEKFQVVQG